jgi:hypothetical protein
VLTEQVNRFKMGMGGLWDDFKECNAIRERQRAPNAPPLTYHEYSMLQRGKEDRNRLLQLAFVWVAIPNAFYLVLSFVPGSVPSTFSTEAEKALKLQGFDTARLRAAIGTLDSLDRECRHKKPERAEEHKHYK